MYIVEDTRHIIFKSVIKQALVTSIKLWLLIIACLKRDPRTYTFETSVEMMVGRMTHVTASINFGVTISRIEKCPTQSPAVVHSISWFFIWNQIVDFNDINASFNMFKKSLKRNLMTNQHQISLMPPQ
jgi:hypothetical protein